MLPFCILSYQAATSWQTGWYISCPDLFSMRVFPFDLAGCLERIRSGPKGLREMSRSLFTGGPSFARIDNFFYGLCARLCLARQLWRLPNPQLLIVPISIFCTPC